MDPGQRSHLSVVRLPQLIADVDGGEEVGAGADVGLLLALHRLPLLLHLLQLLDLLHSLLDGLQDKQRGPSGHAHVRVLQDTHLILLVLVLSDLEEPLVVLDHGVNAQALKLSVGKRDLRGRGNDYGGGVSTKGCGLATYRVIIDRHESWSEESSDVGNTHLVLGLIVYHSAVGIT